MTVCPNIVFGRNGRIWTCDPYTPSVVRYQTALRPDGQTILLIKIFNASPSQLLTQNLFQNLVNLLWVGFTAAGFHYLTD